MRIAALVLGLLVVLAFFWAKRARLRDEFFWIAFVQVLAGFIGAAELLGGQIFANQLSLVGDTCGPHIRHFIFGSHLARTAAPCTFTIESVVWMVLALVPLGMLGVAGLWQRGAERRKDEREKRTAAREAEERLRKYLLKVEDFRAFGTQVHTISSDAFADLLVDAAAKEAEQHTVSDLADYADAACKLIAKALLPLTDRAHLEEFSIDLMLAVRSKEDVEKLGRLLGRDFKHPYGAEGDASDVGLDFLTDKSTAIYLVLVSASRDAFKHAVYLRVPGVGEPGKAMPGAPQAAFRLLSQLADRNESDPRPEPEYDNINDTWNIPQGQWKYESPEARQAVEWHFRRHAKHVRSVLSVALAASMPHGIDIVAVLNVDSSKEDLFRDPGRQHLLLGGIRAFAPLLEGLAGSMLHRLERADVEAHEGGPEGPGNEREVPHDP